MKKKVKTNRKLTDIVTKIRCDFGTHAELVEVLEELYPDGCELVDLFCKFTDEVAELFDVLAETELVDGLYPKPKLYIVQSNKTEGLK